jgi:hypothetical protein
MATAELTSPFARSISLADRLENFTRQCTQSSPWATEASLSRWERVLKWFCHLKLVPYGGEGVNHVPVYTFNSPDRAITIPILDSIPSCRSRSPKRTKVGGLEIWSVPAESCGCFCEALYSIATLFELTSLTRSIQWRSSNLANME